MCAIRKSQTPAEGSKSRANHYSYTFYRDEQNASEYDLDRFGGTVGAWFEALERETYLTLLAPVEGKRILDVGTGTGKLSLSLAAAGAAVTGTDASAAMLAEAVRKSRASPYSERLHFSVTDGHFLPFADRSFDAVLSSRVLMHVPDPEKFVSELCRVTRSLVVLDFPPRSSSNGLQPLLLGLKKWVDPKTHPYRVFSVKTVREFFERKDFAVERLERQFFLPHFVHRRLNRPRISTALERMFKALGLTRVLGAPATIVARRRTS